MNSLHINLYFFFHFFFVVFCILKLFHSMLIFQKRIIQSTKNLFSSGETSTSNFMPQTPTSKKSINTSQTATDDAPLTSIEIGTVVRIQKINDENFDLIGTVNALNTPRKNYYLLKLENGTVQPYSENDFVAETILMVHYNQNSNIQTEIQELFLISLSVFVRLFSQFYSSGAQNWVGKKK